MKQVTFSIGKKFLILNVISATISGLLLGTVFLTQTKDLLIEDELKSVTESISLYKSTLNHQLNALKENVLILSRSPPITGIRRAQLNKGIDPKDDSTEQQWINRLTHIFEDFLSSKSNYVSLRFISLENDGKELIRVNRIQGMVKTTHPDFLQKKGRRDYFKETIKLGKGQVYLSRFSLHKEYGKVALPYTPVIRAATPLFGDDGILFGIIIANLDARDLLKEGMQSHLPFYVTNDKGDYLYHPNIEYTFGFDIGLESKIQTDFPETAIMFKDNQKISEKILIKNIDGDKHFTFFSKLKYAELKPNDFLAIIISETESEIAKNVNKTLYKMILILIAIILANMLFVYFFARRLTSPLMKLIFAAEELTEGKTKINLPTNSNDELGVLASSLETMNQTILQRNIDLKSRELMNRSITDNLNDGLITISEKGLIKTFNPAAEKIFGYEANEAINQNVSMLMPSPYKYKHDDYLKNYAVTRIPKIIGLGREVVGERKNGSTFPMELSVSEMNMPNADGGYKKFFIGLCRNIEERKKSEAKLKEAEQKAMHAKEDAEKANKAKSNFLSRMSHELRTPLNAILGFSQLELEEEYQKNIKDSNIQPIYDAGKHLLELVNDVLDLSKIEANESSLVFDCLEIRDFLKQIHTQAISLARDKHIHVEFLSKLEHEKAFIKADIVRLKQVLLNLVSNAIKYNSENGTVTLSVEELNDGTLRMAVKDNGFGIAEDKMSLLFQAFERLGVESKGIDGTGIGLMISKQLTERMGGHIGVESMENVGSNFYVDFPASEPDEKYLITAELKQHSELAETNFPHNKEIKILYIEDNPTNMAFVNKILSKHENVKFFPAINPVIGINIARKNHPDLILLDLHLPDINGFEVFECLKGYKEIKNVPIIALSASAIKKDINKAISLGFYAYIVKPFEIKNFYQTITAALSEDRGQKTEDR